MPYFRPSIIIARTFANGAVRLGSKKGLYIYLVDVVVKTGVTVDILPNTFVKYREEPHEVLGTVAGMNDGTTIHNFIVSRVVG